MPEVINEFRGTFRFLSNFHPSPIRVRFSNDVHTVAATAEHVFQAFKTRNKTTQRAILRTENPGYAKRLGRTCDLREDWEDIKLNVMRAVVRAKFEQNEDLKFMLFATDDATLIEGNHWNDTFWGVDLKTGQGHNHLGIILMEVRETLRP